MKKITFAMLTITTMLFLGLSVFSEPMVANTAYDTTEERDTYLNIITSNKMQYFMVKSIVGNKHNVEYLFSEEKDSLNYEVTDELIKNVSNMDLFIYTGSNVEKWSSSIIENVKSSNLGIINLSKGIRYINLKSSKDNKENPYYWTGIDEYKIALYNAKTAIQEKDPKNRTYYEENYNKVLKKLEDNVSNIVKEESKANDYVYISLDDSLDYLYKSLNISIFKLDNKTIEDVIKENGLDPSKVILLKDSSTEKISTTYPVIELDKYNSNMSFEDLIMNNLNKIYNFSK